MSALSPGDLAIIIESIMGQSVGAIVQCVAIRGEHSQYGTIWQVRSKGELVSEYGGVGNTVDVPAIWLKKIEPGEQDRNADLAKLDESNLIKQLLERATD